MPRVLDATFRNGIAAPLIGPRDSRHADLQVEDDLRLDGRRYAGLERQ